MLKVLPSNEWKRSTDELACTLSRGERKAVHLGRGSLVASLVAQVQGALYVRVPSEADQVERVLLVIGEALDQRRTVDDRLRAGQLMPLLDELTDPVSKRALIVDGWDRLGGGLGAPELLKALLPRTQAIREWLQSHARLRVVSEFGARPSSAWKLPDAPALRLANGVDAPVPGLDAAYGHDLASYALALAARALGEPIDDLLGLRRRELARRVYDLLPPSVARVLQRLAVHERELPREHLPAGTTDATVRRGLDLGLWVELPTGLALEEEWVAHLREELPVELRRELHRDLASSFFEALQGAEPTSARAGTSVLEAHRHFVAAGEMERARKCWRYGGALVVEAARCRSIARDYAQASSLYDAVLGAAERGELPMDAKLRAYTRHYLHYNRAHAQEETLLSTEAGYRRALDDWQDNALFWSRLIRVHCYRGDLRAALQTLGQANVTVPQHAQKSTVIIARTVRGLLDRIADGGDRILQAVRIWGDYTPDTPFAEEVGERLRVVLENGWNATSLVFDHEALLVFTRPVALRVVQRQSYWTAELRSDQARADGPSPEAALRALVECVRLETMALVRAFSPTLSPAERLRKRNLLGLIDLEASRLGGDRPSAYWVLGRLERDDAGKIGLRAVGERPLWFDLPDEVRGAQEVDEHLHLARIASNDDGVPTGPVLDLEPGFRGSDDELWAEWRRRTSDGG